MDESGYLALVNAFVSKEVGEEERGAGGCVDRRSDDAAAVDVEIHPQRRRLGPSQTNFALEATISLHLETVNTLRQSTPPPTVGRLRRHARMPRGGIMNFVEREIFASAGRLWWRGREESLGTFNLAWWSTGGEESLPNRRVPGIVCCRGPEGPEPREGLPSLSSAIFAS